MMLISHTCCLCTILSRNPHTSNIQEMFGISNHRICIPWNMSPQHISKYHCFCKYVNGPSSVIVLLVSYALVSHHMKVFQPYQKGSLHLSFMQWEHFKRACFRIFFRSSQKWQCWKFIIAGDGTFVQVILPSFQILEVCQSLEAELAFDGT